MDRDEGDRPAMPKYNRYTKEYQEQSHHLCEVARIATRLLYKYYADDERFAVDGLERARLGLSGSHKTYTKEELKELKKAGSSAYQELKKV